MPSANPAPLTVGVLLCDHVSPELQAAAGGDYDDVFHRFLTRAAASIEVPIEVVAFDAINGELPATPHDCDAWVITGSRHTAYADDPWIVQLRQFVRDVVDRDGRVAGICFGHQLVATALGGTVEPATKWKVGPQRMALAATRWFDAATLHLHAMHRDVVTSLPPGAEIIGDGETADVPAYAVGDSVLCIQDHPEFTAEYCAGLLRARSDRIDSETSSDGLQTIATQRTDGDAMGEAILRFLAARPIGKAGT